MANTTILCLYRKQNRNSTNVFQISSTLGTRNSTEQGPNRHVPANCTNSTFPPLSARPRLSAGPVPIIRSPVFRTNRKPSSGFPGGPWTLRWFWRWLGSLDAQVSDFSEGLMYSISLIKKSNFLFKFSYDKSLALW